MKSGLGGVRRGRVDSSVLFLVKGGRLQPLPERTTGLENGARDAEILASGPSLRGLQAASGTGPQGGGAEASELSGWDPVNKEWVRVGQWVCMKQCGACCYLGASDPPADEAVAAQLKDMTASDGWCKHFDKVAVSAVSLTPYFKRYSLHRLSVVLPSRSPSLTFARFSCLLARDLFFLPALSFLCSSIGSDQVSRGCTIYETRPSFCRTSPESFQELYGIAPNQFETVARSSCCEAIADVYGPDSHELDRSVPHFACHYEVFWVLPPCSNS